MKRLEIVNFSTASSVNAMITLLNRALADEWMAVAQYLSPIKRRVSGDLKEEVFSELKEHANEEYEHAVKLKNRIDELGGDPLVDPEDWVKWCNPGGKFTLAFDTTHSLLSVNITSEQGAIKVYKDIMDFAESTKDTITYELAKSIHADEVKHEDDLQKLLDQLDKIDYKGEDK